MLGIEIGIDDEQTITKNYTVIIKKAKSIMQTWAARNLSLLGKVSIINTLIASLFVYPMSVLPLMPRRMVEEIHNEFERFIWNGHKPKIPLRVLQKPKFNGGLGLVNIYEKDAVLKLSWIKRLYDDEKMACLAHHIIDKDLNYKIWMCNLKEEDIDKVAGKDRVGAFWADVLPVWARYNYSNKEASNHILWWNSLIRVNDTPIYLPTAMKKGLFRVRQLYEGNVLISAKLANELYGLSIMEYNSIVSAIPKQCKDFIKKSSAVSDDDVGILPDVLLATNVSKKYYYSKIKDDRYIVTKCEQWAKDIGYILDEDVLTTFLDHIHAVTNVPKYRSFQYRLLYRAIITNIQLKHWGKS